MRRPVRRRPSWVAATGYPPDHSIAAKLRLDIDPVLGSVPMTITKAGAPLAAAFLHGAANTYTPVLFPVALACTVAAAAVTSVGSPRSPRVLTGPDFEHEARNR